MSRQIRDLEEELGVRLLERHGTRTSLTPAGERFAERGREILAASTRAVDEARSAARLLRFGHYGTLWMDHYAPALRRFSRQNPELTLQSIEQTPAELVKALRRGEVDIALLGPIDDALRREFATLHLGQVPAMLAIAADRPLAKRRSYSVVDLKDAAWIAWDDQHFPQRSNLLRDAAKAAGFKARIVDSVDSVASLFINVANSRAIGYVLPMSKKLPHSGVVFAQLKPPGIIF